MDPEALAALGITVHTIKGYGDTAVAEHAFALMWAAARGLARMDRGDAPKAAWVRTEGMQLTGGKTIGLLVGYGGIGVEMARLARGIGMRVLAWNRTAREAEGVAVRRPSSSCWRRAMPLSIHLLLTDETRGLLDAARAGAAAARSRSW